MKKLLTTALLLALSAAALKTTAQVDTGIKITPRQDGGTLLDSVKQAGYPYTFPLLGKKAAGKGFLLPYPFGIMLNGFQGSQEVSISDISVGVDRADGSMAIPETSLDKVVGFGDVRATISNINMRADLWVLPFLDVYGIFGKAWVKTDVNIASIFNHPVDVSTQARFDGYVYGWGAMLAGGVRSFFASTDFNMIWSHFDEMSSSNQVMNISVRTGYVIHFHKPERNIAFWGGAGRIFMNGDTHGTIKLSDIAPDLGANYQSSDWYVQMNAVQQALTDRVVANFTDKNKGDLINYSLQKRPTHNWAMILGAQYQLSRRWQFRTEVNMLSGRRSGLLSVNYRFGIK